MALPPFFRKRAIRQCREELHLSQADVARIMGLSKSHYSMMEKGQRTTPWHVQESLLEMAAKVEQSPDLPPPGWLVNHWAKRNHSLEATQRELNRKLVETEHKLTRVIDKYKNLLKRHQAVSVVLRSMPLGERATAYLESLIFQSGRKLSDCSPLKQARLFLKICTITDQLYWIARLLEQKPEDLMAEEEGDENGYIFIPTEELKDRKRE